MLDNTSASGKLEVSTAIDDLTGAASSFECGKFVRSSTVVELTGVAKEDRLVRFAAEGDLTGDPVGEGRVELLVLSVF